MRFQHPLVVVLAFGLTAAVAAPGFAGNEAEAALTYYKDILPILQENCQTCHRPSGHNISGNVAPMSFMDYQETRPWARAIARKVEAREMPPWFASEPTGVFSNERGLTDREIDSIVRWVDAGAPAGDVADAPSPKQWLEEANGGWSVGTPDFVVKMPEPYLIEDDIYDLNITFYKKLTDADLPEDTWVKGWEFRTGNNRVTHHMCSYLLPPSDDAPADGTAVEDEGADVRGSRLLSCIAEGAESSMLPEGFGVRLEKGSTIAFQMHYHKEPGVESGVWSQAEIGFFIEREPVQYKVVNDSLFNRGFEIPPNHPNYRIGSSRLLEQDTLVLTLWPHAHTRAFAARYTAFYPDGREELLLDVPRYDQGWQVTYRYKEPKLLPKGTRIDLDFWYDNTPERGARKSFDSNRFVGYGPRTDDEMSLGFIGYAEIDPDASSTDNNDDD
jgi:mono/diheme cytochrome c family protein